MSTYSIESGRIIQLISMHLCIIIIINQLEIKSDFKSRPANVSVNSRVRGQNRVFLNGGLIARGHG